MTPLAITGLGVVAPFAIGYDAFRAALDVPMDAAAPGPSAWLDTRER